MIQEIDMNRTTLLLLLMMTLLLTACSGSASNAAVPTSNGQGGLGAGELSAPLEIAIGTIKLDGSSNAVTAEQARELLPLWQTLQGLESSDTAATEEKDALRTQIQETMTQEQTRAITALNLTRRDMASIMQSQMQTFGATQNNGTTQRNGTSGNSGRNFGPAGGGFAGAPPPDGGGGFPGGGPEVQRQSQSQSNGTSQNNSNTQFTADPNRIPTPLIQAVIDYLKSKAGS
jgi:hypothetical protein